jgi:ABC-2 type transport system ATP-binding protein
MGRWRPSDFGIWTRSTGDAAINVIDMAPEHRQLIPHDMADIAHLCQRMLLIDHGQLLYDGAVAAIRERFGIERTLVVDLAKDETVHGPLNIGLAAQVQANRPRRWLRFRRQEITAAALIAAVSARYRIRDLTIEEPEIESIVRRIYEEGL